MGNITDDILTSWGDGEVMAGACQVGTTEAGRRRDVMAVIRMESSEGPNRRDNQGTT